MISNGQRVLLIAALFAFANQSWADCGRGAVSCTAMSGVKTCRADVTCTLPMVNRSASLTLISSTGVNDCLPAMDSGMAGMFSNMVYFDITAVASTTAQMTHTCAWRWQTNPTRGGTGLIDISEAHGLPIELMEFEIDQ